MSKEAKVLILFLLAFIVSKIWTVLPESDVERDYFLYADQVITERTHLYFIFERVQMMIIVSAFSLLISKYKVEFNILFFVVTLDLFDYLLFYCEPMFYLYKYPVEWSLIKGIFIALVGAKCLYTEIKNPPN
jgi:hypothetical protein